LTGVTGARSEIQIRTLELVKRFVKLTKGKVPLGVGFGISKPDHVRQLVKAGVDAAIVGSSFVDIIAKNLEDIEDACTNLEVETRRLKEATRNS
jgi:tryptophan synthase alpha chain